ncbi:4-alpha-glucanotransferase [Gordonia jinghuaiqii]|uniref:4-alpha-glucanotransferase n=1 Tax=Gordonia jinghuaiqii TaxID=2758710 RepID=A0A7D7LZX0_9ACTN|nr:4-alpha-glucanotransferase [Gordonia jinghuaiqii]MCR5979628.1 4-alpha-glucanotransferase [Gordonia jinghuaiqii]QMT03979.1 4-alpha-glucanotransferase [Gordonia jinghuaiqii]
MNPDRLTDLARRYGVATSYVGWGEQNHEVSVETLVAVLAALGVAADSDEAIEASIREIDEQPWREFVPAVTVVTEGAGSTFVVHVPHGNLVKVWIVTEDGDDVAAPQLDVWVEPRNIDGALVGRATFAVPADLAPGYHHIKALDLDRSAAATAPLIVTPRRLDTADRLLGHKRWGLAAQLYSIRSADSWGVGDFADLAGICEVAGSAYGADFVQVNPLHAAQPQPPIEASPYLPVTRRFVNPLYIRVTDIPELEGLPRSRRKWVRALGRGFLSENTATDMIRRDKSYRAKMEALELIYGVPLDPARKTAYREFRRREGKGLKRFATWCALAERYDADDRRWHGKFLDPAYMKKKRRKLARRIDFHMWLQWICDEQLAAAARAATSAGCSIGVMADLAVGVARHSADAWALGDVLATGATVGAPPDGFNQQGQGWDQPPWHPRRLAEAGYEPYRDMIRTVLRHAGGVRVDHILGLFRLWWIPDGRSPADGTYVRYDSEALIGILALEAQRADAVVVGEDLGVFEPSVQDALRERGILGTSILWFEQGRSAAIPPEDYRELCLTSVTTHDLPPTVGYLAGDHIALRSRLGLLESGEAAERARDARERDAVLELAYERGLLSRDTPLTDPKVVDALYAVIARSPSVLLSVALVDAVGERRIQNQPGTDSTQYPNWCIPLADADGEVVLVEDLVSSSRFRQLVATLNSAGVPDA